jgi:cobaltochelatase CobS
MVTPQPNESPAQLAERLFKRVLEERAAKAERERLAMLAASKVAAPKPPEPEVATPKGGRLHYKFPLFLAAAKAGVNCIALVGPSGTGKTKSSSMVAKILGIPFEATSFGPTTSKTELFGYCDLNGVYHDTSLVRAATKGGVFLGDEFDAGHAGVSTALNMVTANDVFAIPTGMVEKHKNFLAVLAMNTYGNGANRVYVGRNQQDGATMDRCVVIDWDQDEGLEAEICGVSGIPSPTIDLKAGGILNPDQWLNRVWKIRKAIDVLGIRHIVSTRASIHGCKLFAQGVGQAHVEQMCIWKGLDTDSKMKIMAKL